MRLSENPLYRYQMYVSSQYRFRLYPIATGAVLVSIAVTTLFLFYLFLMTKPGLGAVSFLLFVSCIVAPLIAYRAFSQEYERATWEFLAVSPLSAWDILAGKLVPSLIRWSIFFLFGALLTLAGFHDQSYSQLGAAPGFEAWFLSYLSVWSWGVLLVCASGWLSFRMRNTIAVVALMFTSQVVLLFLIPVLINIFYINPFMTISYFIFDKKDVLHYMLWGWVQSGVYLSLAGLFVYLTLRGIRKEWRKR